jgi:hypothetical protein
MDQAAEDDSLTPLVLQPRLFIGVDQALRVRSGQNIFIDGRGATLWGRLQSSVFYVQYGTLSLYNVTLHQVGGARRMFPFLSRKSGIGMIQRGGNKRRRLKSVRSCRMMFACSTRSH